jgi:hypothetical protein
LLRAGVLANPAAAVRPPVAKRRKVADAKPVGALQVPAAAPREERKKAGLSESDAAVDDPGADDDVQLVEDGEQIPSEEIPVIIDLTNDDEDGDGDNGHQGAPTQPSPPKVLSMAPSEEGPGGIEVTV